MEKTKQQCFLSANSALARQLFSTILSAPDLLFPQLVTSIYWKSVAKPFLIRYFFKISISFFDMGFHIFLTWVVASS